MVCVYSKEYKITHTELKFRGYTDDKARDIIKRLVSLRVPMVNTKVTHRTIKFGKECDEIQWVMGLDLNIAITRLTEYLTKAKPTANLSFWKRVLKSLNQIDTELKTKIIQGVTDDTSGCVKFFRINSK